MSEISEADNQRLHAQQVMEERIANLQLAIQKFQEDKHILTPKIQKVPAFLRRDAEFAKYYSPKMISFGPIHHNDKNLKQGEDYKLLWTSMYIEDYSKTNNQVITPQSLLNEIQSDLGELKKLFTKDAIGTKTTDEDLAWMLFVDGCSLLYFMENVDKQSPEVLGLKLDQMMHICRDIFMLENQLPRRLLELLSKDKGVGLDSLMEKFYFAGVIKQCREKEVRHENKNKQFYIDFAHFKSKKKEVDLEQSTPEGGKDYKPIHILDYARRYVTSSTHKEENGKYVKNQQDGNDSEQNSLWLTFKNIRDLKTAGIRVKANKTNEWKWSNISFTTSKFFYGVLMLPVFVFDNDAPYFFRNLIAYEMSPDFRNDLECCSYVCFMDSLIDNGEDVKELRLAGVIQNLLGSDEELAKLFNDLGRVLPTKIFNNSWRSKAVAYSKKYIQVKDQIEKHYTNKWRTGFAVVINTHFNNPWSAIAFIAAVVALILTCVQTWFAVYPKNS